MISVASAAFVLSTILPAADSIYEFTLNDIDGKPTPMANFKGKAVLFVNVASLCAFAPQYEGLQKLYEKYKDRGFVVIGVPANDFGGMEPGSNADIKKFCSRNYGVTFPMMSKVSVTGPAMTPLYGYLASATGGNVAWNFTKFLIGKDGKVLSRFDSSTEPESPDIVSAIEKAVK